MLLCMSCFARILIQWSVRSSMEEIRGSSVRSSSRFFSLFGGSFSRHWDRPPPTYAESLKPINPDLQPGPPDPPPYSESFRARSGILQQNNSLKTAEWHNNAVYFYNYYDDHYISIAPHCTTHYTTYFIIHFIPLRFPLSRSLLALRSSSGSAVAGGTAVSVSVSVSGSATPPPIYTSCENVRQVRVFIKEYFL